MKEQGMNTRLVVYMVLCVLEGRWQATKFSFSALFIHIPVSHLKKAYWVTDIRGFVKF